MLSQGASHHLSIEMQEVRCVRLSNNPISAEGISALAAMLEFNPDIIEVDVSGNHCERSYSHVHHSSESTGNLALDPSPDTIAQTALHKNLKRNQVQCAAVT